MIKQNLPFILKKLVKLPYSLYNFIRLQFHLAFKKRIKVIIAASGHYQRGWTPTIQRNLDLLDERKWSRLFHPDRLEAILAEHVWEHLNEEQGQIAFRNCYKYLKKGGYLRIAVPDGNNPDPVYNEYVKPNGTGPGADDHKILYNYKSITDSLKSAGFENVILLEYYDDNQEFHAVEWDPDKGKIIRSKRFDKIKREVRMNYSSLIVDAVK